MFLFLKLFMLQALFVSFYKLQSFLKYFFIQDASIFHVCSTNWLHACILPILSALLIRVRFDFWPVYEYVHRELCYRRVVIVYSRVIEWYVTSSVLAIFLPICSETCRYGGIYPSESNENFDCMRPNTFGMNQFKSMMPKIYQLRRVKLNLVLEFCWISRVLVSNFQSVIALSTNMR